jgi:uncharacterized protein YjbI with pentapeptide repeats
MSNEYRPAGTTTGNIRTASASDKTTRTLIRDRAQYLVKYRFNSDNRADNVLRKHVLDKGIIIRGLLVDCSITDCDLVDCIIEKCCIVNCSITNCDLEDCVTENCDLVGCDIEAWEYMH